MKRQIITLTNQLIRLLILDEDEMLSRVIEAITYGEQIEEEDNKCWCRLCDNVLDCPQSGDWENCGINDTIAEQQEEEY